MHQFKVLYIPVGIILTTLVLSYITEGFWSGYSVEFAGIVLEVAIVYLVVDKAIKNNQKKEEAKLREPVLTKLLENVTSLQESLFNSLNHFIRQLERIHNGKVADNYIPEVYTYDALNRRREHLLRYLTHASFHMGTKTYTKVMDYVEFTDELIFLVNQLESLTATPKAYASVNVSFSIRAKTLMESERFFKQLKENAPELTRPFFKSHYIVTSLKNLPKAEDLISRMRELNCIKVT